MPERGQIRFQWPIYRSVIEESYPTTPVYDKAHRIHDLHGPRETCIAEWVDSDFGTSEPTAVDVPIHGLDRASLSCSAKELAWFNAREVSARSSRRRRRRRRRRKREPLPHGMLIRAMYMALAELRSGPTGPLVPLDSAYTPVATDTTALDDIRALRVQVRRRLWCFETPVIADGEITVRRADQSDSVNRVES